MTRYLQYVSRYLHSGRKINVEIWFRKAPSRGGRKYDAEIVEWIDGKSKKIWKQVFDYETDVEHMVQVAEVKMKEMYPHAEGRES